MGKNFRQNRKNKGRLFCPSLQTVESQSITSSSNLICQIELLPIVLHLLLGSFYNWPLKFGKGLIHY